MVYTGKGDCSDEVTLSSYGSFALRETDSGVDSDSDSCSVQK